ncbi:MAG: hypothetical protein JJ895_15900 [Balneolaceae bacterium]|nr:hypothetical protein [Balneolaceae bacterium]
MLKLIFFLILFWVISRYIRRMFLPSGGQKNHFNPPRPRSRSGRRNLDQIEEADYEDLSDNTK